MICWTQSNQLINQYILSILYRFLSIQLSIYISIYLYIYQSVRPSVCLSVYLSIYRSNYLSIYLPRREAGGFMISPPVRNLGCQFDPIYLYLLSYSSAQPCRYFCLIRFCFWPILLICFSLKIHFLKGRLFCVAFIQFFCLSGQEMSTLAGGMQNLCCHMALILAFAHLYSIFNLRFLLVHFCL